MKAALFTNKNDKDLAIKDMPHLSAAIMRPLVPSKPRR